MLACPLSMPSHSTLQTRRSDHGYSLRQPEFIFFIRHLTQHVIANNHCFWISYTPFRITISAPWGVM